jgi:hypothetical protein
MIKINANSIDPPITLFKADVKSLFGLTNWVESAVFVLNEFNIVIKFEEVDSAD